MRSLKQRKHKKNNSLRQYKKMKNKRNNKRNKKMIGGDNNSFEIKDEIFDNKTITNENNTQLLEKISDINKLKKIINQMNFINDDITFLQKYYKNAILFYKKNPNYNEENSWDPPFIRSSTNFNIDQLIQQLEDKRQMIETRIKLLEERENKIKEQTIVDSEVINPIFQTMTNEGTPPIKIKDDQFDFDKLFNKYKQDDNLEVFKEGLKENQSLIDILNKREINIEEKQKLEKYYDNIDIFYTKTFEVEQGNDTFFPENKKFDKDKTIKNLEENKKDITRFLESVSLGSENTSIEVIDPITTNIGDVGSKVNTDADSNEATGLKKAYDDKIKENENKIQELLKIQESEKIRIKNITDTSSKIDSQNAKMVSELEEIQNALNSSIQNDNNCQNESNSLKISIENFKKQNREADNKQKELIQELQNLQTHNTEIQESYNKINEEFIQKNTILETQLTETKQREQNLKSELDKRVKETIVLNADLNNTKKMVMQLEEKSKETTLKAEKEKDDLQRKTEENINQIKSETDKERKTLTETHTTAISKKNEENKELNNQITDLIEERDSLKTDLLSALLKDPTKIEVSLDKKQFYEDICKNIKNIIINAYFLDMLFDKQLESKPKLKGGGDGDGEIRSSMSSADEERYINIEEMKKNILSARDNLNNFLKNLVSKLSINNPKILSELQNIDGFAKTALQVNMATYLAASIFFMMGGDKGVNDKEVNKGNKKGKTLKSLGLRNKKLTKSLRSIMMKGGLTPENSANLDNLITKVITDICQQMTLTKDLLRYVPVMSIDTNSFEQGLLIFTTVYKEKNRSDKIEPITNFLVPYKEPEIKNQDIAKLIEEINKYLNQKKENQAEVDKLLDPNSGKDQQQKVFDEVKI